VNIDDPCPLGLEKDGTCVNLRSFWSSEELEPSEEGGSVYVAKQEVPEDGRWTAFMIQVTFEEKKEEEGLEGFIPRAKKGELVFTTEVSVVPDVYPYDDCYMETCEGNLV